MEPGNKGNNKLTGNSLTSLIIITADDLGNKINKIADALIQLDEVLKLQSDQSIAIKNVVVVSALVQTK